MPNEPRIEPTLEELSAYIDHELGAADQARVAEHVATCADCQVRLGGLRQTVHAVRGLPQETPPRRFTLPQAQSSRSFRWAPVGWIGGVAAALVIVVIGVTHLPAPAGNTASTSFAGNGAHQASAPNPAALSQLPGAANRDQNFYAPKGAVAITRTAAVADPTSSARRLVLGSDAANYSANGTISVRVMLQGDPSPSIDAQAQGLSLVLVRNGSGVALGNLSGSRAYGGPPIFDGSYAITNLPLNQPVPGQYTLIASWTIPDGSGRVLQTSLPITITGS